MQVRLSDAAYLARSSIEPLPHAIHSLQGRSIVLRNILFDDGQPPHRAEFQVNSSSGLKVMWTPKNGAKGWV